MRRRSLVFGVSLALVGILGIAVLVDVQTVGADRHVRRVVAALWLEQNLLTIAVASASLGLAIGVASGAYDAFREVADR